MLTRKESQNTQDQSQNLTDFCNYIAAKKLIFKGIKNKIIFFQAKNEKQLVCIQMFAQNGQMKMLKKIIVHHRGVTFMNKADYFINSGFLSISLWKLDTFQNWNYYKTIFSQEKSEVYYKFIFDDNIDVCQLFGVSNQDDLIVTSEYYKTFFIKKDNNGNWMCNQIINTDHQLLLKFTFNEQGNILIANLFYQCQLIIFKKNVKNEMWRITQIINIQQNQEPFCFIEDYTFALLESRSSFLTKWEINVEAAIARKIYETEVQEHQRFKDLKLIKSKDLLLAVSQNFCYLIKLSLGNFQIKQIASVSKDFETKYCNNEQILLFSQGNEQLSQYYKISIKRIYEN